MTPHAPLMLLQAEMPGRPESDHPRPERRLAGNPRRDTWNLLDQPVPAGRLYCGIWRSEAGHWRIEMAPREHELFTVLEGRVRVHAEDGSFQEAGPGQGLVIPGGFRGSFEVLEPVVKTYAIVSADA